MKHLFKGLSLAILSFATSLCAAGESPQQITHATWYAGPCIGRILADGKRYKKDAAFVATHQPYPFGTKLRITNLRNHRSIVVPVEDREPFHPGRTIDLSYAAAKQLDMISAGVVLVSYSIVSPATQPKGGF